MGTLALPPSGLVYLDTQVVIYSVERIARYWPLLQPVWAASQAGTIQLVTSELTLLETLVGPFKSGDATLAAAYERLLESTEVRLEPITRPILREAGRVRALAGLKAPDAIHAATAMTVGCGTFLGNDYGLKKVARLPVLMLDDALSTP